MTSLIGFGQSFPQALMTSTSTADQLQVGTRSESADGRQFVYVKAGASALVPGTLQQGPAIVADHQNIAVAAAAAIGATTITVTLGATAATANQYAGGYVVVNDVTGEGNTYLVSSHPAADASASLVLTLSDAVNVALTTSSQVSLIANPYNGVIINPTTPTGVPVGVAVYAVAAGEYGWIQTRGAVSCLNDGNTTVGLAVAPSQSVAGAVKTGATTLDSVGSALQTAVSTEYNCISIRL